MTKNNLLRYLEKEDQGSRCEECNSKNGVFAWHMWEEGGTTLYVECMREAVRQYDKKFSSPEAERIATAHGNGKAK